MLTVELLDNGRSGLFSPGQHLVDIDTGFSYRRHRLIDLFIQIFIFRVPRWLSLQHVQDPEHQIELFLRQGRQRIVRWGRRWAQMLPG